MGTEACEISQPVNRLDRTLSPHEERAGRELERGATRGSIAVFCDAPPLPNPLLRCAEEREAGASSSTAAAPAVPTRRGGRVARMQLIERISPSGSHQHYCPLTPCEPRGGNKKPARQRPGRLG